MLLSHYLTQGNIWGNLMKMEWCFRDIYQCQMLQLGINMCSFETMQIFDFIKKNDFFLIFFNFFNFFSIFYKKFNFLKYFHFFYKKSFSTSSKNRTSGSVNRESSNSRLIYLPKLLFSSVCGEFLELAYYQRDDHWPPEEQGTPDVVSPGR